MKILAGLVDGFILAFLGQCSSQSPSLHLRKKAAALSFLLPLSGEFWGVLGTVYLMGDIFEPYG
jgi:hypothetical protein